MTIALRGSDLGASRVRQRLRRAARLARAALVCMAVLGSGSTAKGAEPSPEDVAQARMHFDEGMQLATAARWPEAYAAFAAAWKKKQHPQVAANLGRAAFKMKKFGEAAEFLSYFLREAQNVLPEDRRLTEAMLADATAKALPIEITVSKPGATVLVDALFVGVSPLGRSILVDVGRHDLVARGDDGVEASTRIEATRGGENRFVIAFPEEARAAAPPPPVPPPVPVGGPGDPTGGVDARIVGAGVGLTAVGLGLWVAAALVSRSADDELDSKHRAAKRRTPDQEEALSKDWAAVNSRGRDWARVSYGALIGSGIMATATVGYLLSASSKDEREESNSTASVDVNVAPGSAGITIAGRW